MRRPAPRGRCPSARDTAAPPALMRLCSLTPATASEPDPLSALLAWAVRVAREVRRRYRFRSDSQEEHDLVAQAHLVVCRGAARFRPELVPPGGDVQGAFKGYIHVEVKSQCVRLRNGGTYHTRRESPGAALVAAPFSDLAADDGAPFDTAGPRDDATPAVHEPDRDPDWPEPEPLPADVPYLYGRRVARRRA